jgi:hypothetical protein
MKHPFTFCCFILSVMFVSLPGCKHNKQKADIPDIQSTYKNINYLDSLIRSDQVDSVGKINDHITATILAYKNRAQSPEDKAILDSLIRINLVTTDFIRYCADNRSNLELLDQDAKALENQYRSGKVKIAAYISALMEEEQILIDISNQLASKYEMALKYLKNQSALINKLNPLPVQEN